MVKIYYTTLGEKKLTKEKGTTFSFKQYKA